MPVSVRLLKNTYYDSVYLMGLGGKLARQPGVARNAALMATPANKEVLEEFGVPDRELDGAGPTDLVLAVDAETAEAAGAALALVDGWLAESVEEFAGETASSLDGALNLLPDANLAVISVPGEYAASEAKRALEKGLHVFIFSDNVSIEDELELKQLGAEKGLLVMGPDCGTAIISGVGIGFANVVRRGNIGIVGPSGTGIQQVSCLIDRAGAGISHAIGTGSHDLSDAIGGITTLQALDALAEDEQTEVILIVSKPPGPQTRQRVLDWIANSPKPVVTCFLGLDETPQVAAHHVPVRTLDDAGRSATDLVLGPTAEQAQPLQLSRLGRPLAAQGCVRGLFAGGTHCYEAQQIFIKAGIEVRSNAPLVRDMALASPLQSEGHSLIDLGDDVFTRGRPHPMIDVALRNERIIAEAAHPEVLIILLDFILGYGAMADPVGDTLPAIQAARAAAEAAGKALAFVASVCGTDADPQSLANQVERLKQEGVTVARSSTQAALMALSILSAIETAMAAKGAGRHQ